MRPAALRRTVGLPLVLGLLAACSGGGGGGGTSVDPNAPVIANLRVTFGRPCLLPSNLPGTVEVLTFDFADADGNVSGGSLENITVSPTGQEFTINTPISSPRVRTTGTTSG